jgi:AraC family transcriptional regulator of arabinose operon
MDCAAKLMDYPAGMNPPRAITPNVNADPIVVGEFRQGSGYMNWRPRGSDDWLLIMTRAGAGRVKLKDRDLRLREGDAVLFAPGAMQDYETDRAAGRWHLLWAHFQPRPHWRPWLMWPEIAPKTGCLRLRGSTEAAVAAALQRMQTAGRLGGNGCAELAMNALEEALIWTFRAGGREPRAGGDARVQRAADYLASHPDQPFHLEKLAAHCGLSPSRLSHLFRAVMGATPQRFAETLRMDIARQLLAQTNLSVGEVAQEVGFADALYFSRRFRRAFGRPPSAARGAD